jgi:DNA-binding winged helix-turn-helix (wHTH) protein
MAGNETFHFDDFTLDVRERRLLRGTEAVRLSPKAYGVLVALVQQRHLVTKEELLRRLWPESFVEEGSLNVYVSALRKRLARPPTGRSISKQWRDQGTASSLQSRAIWPTRSH